MAAGALLAAPPIGIHASADGLNLSPATAQAKQGADDKTKERRGRGGDDTRPDDRGGKGRGSGADDTKLEDRGGKGHGSDD